MTKKALLCIAMCFWYQTFSGMEEKNNEPLLKIEDRAQLKSLVERGKKIFDLIFGEHREDDDSEHILCDNLDGPLNTLRQLFIQLKFSSHNPADTLIREISKNSEYIELLFSIVKHPDRQASLLENIILIAIADNQIPILQFFLNHHINIRTLEILGAPVLNWAILNCHVEMVQFLIDSVGVDATGCDNLFGSALEKAHFIKCDLVKPCTDSERETARKTALDKINSIIQLISGSMVTGAWLSKYNT